MIPKYLFHYTSIESARKILLTHKIRFTRLDLLNDPYEGDFSLPEISVTQKDKRKLIYCSCWNGDENETINLWHIYTNMKGVRLKLKSSMFSKAMFLEEQESGFFPVNEISPIYVPYPALNNVIKQVHGPLKISYVNSFEDAYASVVGKSIANPGTDNEFEMYDINLRELGIKKINHWEYEREWRYKVSPCVEIHGSRSAMEAPFEVDTPEYVDIPFIEEIEEILLAPLVCNQEYKALSQFIGTNNINVPLKRSAIQYRHKN